MSQKEEGPSRLSFPATKAKLSASVYAIMPTRLCHSFFGRKPREVCFFQKKVLVLC